MPAATRSASSRRLATDTKHPSSAAPSPHPVSRPGTSRRRTTRCPSPLQLLAVSAANMMPSPIVSMLGGGEGWRPPFNVTISNVPGPLDPALPELCSPPGRVPGVDPVHGQALNISITSYDHHLHFGLTGCRRPGPHLQRLLAHLEASLAELELAVGLSSAPRPEDPRFRDVWPRPKRNVVWIGVVRAPDPHEGRQGKRAAARLQVLVARRRGCTASARSPAGHHLGRPVRRGRSGPGARPSSVLVEAARAGPAELR